MAIFTEDMFGRFVLNNLWIIMYSITPSTFDKLVTRVAIRF